MKRIHNQIKRTHNQMKRARKRMKIVHNRMNREHMDDCGRDLFCAKDSIGDPLRRAISALCVKSMGSFHYIMRRSHCVM